MSYPQNPTHGQIHTLQDGTRRNWNDTLKVWEKIVDVVVKPSTQGTTSVATKIWTGTIGEYAAILEKDPEVMYFVKD